MSMPTIKYVRAFTLRGGGADYHDQSDGHWIDDHIATPMSKYEDYRQSRRSFGLNVLGTLVVEIEASDGTVGFSVTTGGELGCWIIEKHLARFIEGARITDIEKIWDQMFNATLFYGRKGIVLNTISGVDLALWDLLAKVRKEPVHALLGGPVRDEGLKKNLELLGDMRSRVGDDFWLMYDCWMSLDVEYATRLARAAREEYGLKWIEEALPPDDYWGYAELRRNVPRGLLVTTGEHEATRWGFRMLLENEELVMKMFEGRFAGRTAVVTGGASGLGRDVARRIVAEGGRVSIWDLNADLVADASKAIGASHVAVLDVADYRAVSEAAVSAHTALGRVDVLVNSAGITGATALLHEYPVEHWIRVIEVNLNGTFYCCRAVVPFMLASGYGRVVNIASVAGKEGNPNASAYSASKAGVIGLTKSLGKELATKGVLVNCITPATFQSPILEQLPQSQVEYMRSRIPMGRLGEIHETTAMACWLASDECSFSTAATFDTSGGRTTY